MGGTGERSQKGIAKRDRTGGRQTWGAEGGRVWPRGAQELGDQ